MAVTNNVPNTQLQESKSGSNLDLTLTCNSGYVFDGIPKFTYFNTSGDPSQKDFTVNKTNNVATCSVKNYDYNGKVAGKTVKGGTVDVTVTNNISGTTEQHSFDGETLNITVTGQDSRKRFFDAKVGYFTTEGNPASQNMQTDINKATAVITGLDPAHYVTITGTFEPICEVTNNLANCTVNGGLPPYYKVGAVVDVTLTANAGTEFDETQYPPTLYYLNDDGNPTRKDFTISPDKNTANIVFDMSDPKNLALNGVNLTFNGGAVPKLVIGGNYGAINVYIVTLDNLAAFAKKRFFREAPDPETGQTFEYIDLGKYVNRIKRIHCTVPSSSTDVLRCGNYNTNINVLAPAVETINLDFGSVEIPAHNSDNADYESEVQVFLPFKGFVTIPADYVGKSVNLEYVVNVITGYGVAKLSCNGAVFQVEEVNPATDVLYRTADVNLTLIGSDSWDESISYGLTPYIYMKWYESRNKNERNTDNVTGKIGDFSGFIKLDNVSTIITQDMLIMEQEMIYSELENGVYIE